MLWARGSTIVSQARRMLRTHVYCACRKEGRGKHMSGVFGQILCALPECWQYQSDCIIE